MNYETLLVEIKQGVGVIWMNRPERQNTLDHIVISELKQAFSSLEKDDGVRVVVLAGTGSCFCAGNDREAMLNIAANCQDRNLIDIQGMANLLHVINKLAKPTIARVHGCAFNGGAALVAACDMAISEYGAEFSLSDLRIGLSPTTMMPYLVKAMGERMARNYFLSGEQFTAAEAYRTGLLTDITPPEELDGRLNELIGKVIQGAPQAQANLKEWIMESSGLPITPETIIKSSDRFAGSCASDEFLHGIEDIVAKRKPFWLLKKKKTAVGKKKVKSMS
jgi:methylglutaconyl-CoA hydratase